MLKEPELTAGEKLRWKALRGKVPGYDVGQQTGTVSLQGGLKYYEGLRDWGFQVRQNWQQ